LRRRRKIAVFCSQLLDYGGAERLVFEEATHLREAGWDVEVAALRFDPKVRFAGAYGEPVRELSGSATPGRVGKAGSFVAWELALARWLLGSRPDLVIALSATDCALLWAPAALARVPYITHINGTIFWFPTDRTKYSLVHRRGLRRILDVSPFSREFVPSRRPAMALRVRLKSEAAALVHWLGVRGAQRRVTFSRRMAWEVRQLYGVAAEELKGAFPEAALRYEPKGDPLGRFRIAGGPVVLNVNRLESRKRVELAVRAFAAVAADRPDVSLVIGGLGPDAEQIDALIKDLALSSRVFRAGFIPEADLPDWIGACEVFIHPNWAEFAIAPYEALALGKKVIWSSEMEMDPEVAATGLVYVADPQVGPMAAQLARALDAPAPDRAVTAKLRRYSWETYFEALERTAAEAARRPGRR